MRLKMYHKVIDVDTMRNIIDELQKSTISEAQLLIIKCLIQNSSNGKLTLIKSFTKKFIE